MYGLDWPIMELTTPPCNGLGSCLGYTIHFMYVQSSLSILVTLDLTSCPEYRGVLISEVHLLTALIIEVTLFQNVHAPVHQQV